MVISGCKFELYPFVISELYLSGPFAENIFVVFVDIPVLISRFSFLCVSGIVVYCKVVFTVVRHSTGWVI